MPQTVHLALPCCVRISYFLFSVIGLIVVASTFALCLLPQWRDALTTRLMPFFISVAQTETRSTIEPLITPSIEPLLGIAETVSKKATISPCSAPINPVNPAKTDVSSRLMPVSTHQPIQQTQQTLITHYLARRYRVARQPMCYFVRAAFDTGRELSLDPLLLLAVIAIESSFNPFAESSVGAQGLMQVMSEIHAKKFDDFGGQAAALEPFINIKVGALILKEYIALDGSLTGGLRRYVGAKSPDDNRYGAKVLAEHARLHKVIHTQPNLFQMGLSDEQKPI